MIRFEKGEEPETLGECQSYDIITSGTFVGIVGPRMSMPDGYGAYGRFITWRDGTGSVHPLGKKIKRIGRLVWE